jgi:aquaporin Z
VNGRGGRWSFASKLGAEALGTFLITATAISVDVFYYAGREVDYVSRWLARGFVATAVIYAFSEISGAHADPAVTIGFALRRLLPVSMSAAYIAAQFVGSFAASLLLVTLFGSSFILGASHPGPHFSGLTAMLCELVLTFTLMLVILMTAQQEATIGKQAALAVGFIIAVCGLAAGPISGASMNPARTIAPQILAGAFGNIWIYAVGPLLGSAVAVLVYELICGGPPTRGERKAARGQ